ncbi:hypothetical protein [Engelhardtia mirabilis]|uniref:Uncharacterized protein n=1 Tax=Engelhardtia mirabilis TaxID=2528011 RepID=A0A518BPN4_9BACT|nr:hypothetical protein Pla133_40570 [Planctomycetes bacterium Pla133]QDV03269.1 hypothetical protein Pla86_40560 [Planctomycetes bacterium Pla86]
MQELRLWLKELPEEVSETVEQGVKMLARARDYARGTNHDEWDFAVEIERLRAIGLTECELRWLICKGLVATALETSESGQVDRSFEHSGGIRLGDRSCFVVTEFGSSLVEAHARAPQLVDVPLVSAARSRAAKPEWNPSSRLLQLDGRVIKHFRVPAKNQERILSCFAEEGWPEHILDPLPPLPSIEPKRRLQSAIMCLNRNQRLPLLRFRGDGNGTGLLWELRRAAS